MVLQNGSITGKMHDELMQLTLQIRNRKDVDKKYASFRGDRLLATLDAASIAGSLSDYSVLRQQFVDDQVKKKYDAMLHPDGKFNSVISPHLGQAGAPYAKTVPSKTAPLGALPDPGDIFDKLMAREEGGRQSTSGLSSMLIYHATIIIHDIFRTNDNDKNILDSSSYLDLSPLYGYTMDTQRKVRDNKYKLGLLKPDTFAEDRLLRQPPGVCVMLVMYNRYHNYAARTLHRINENGHFSIPAKYVDSQLVSAVKNFHRPKDVPIAIKRFDPEVVEQCNAYEVALKAFQAADTGSDDCKNSKEAAQLSECEEVLNILLYAWTSRQKVDEFKGLYDAAWKKLDDDLFNTARLITCGMYIQISVHDYLRALMGFHQFDTNLTFDPRSDFDQKRTTRGLGNQVTVEFNLLYRFHCAISLKDEKYTEDFMKSWLGLEKPDSTSLQGFLAAMATMGKDAKAKAEAGELPPEPCQVTFGIPGDETRHYERNKITNLFDDQHLINALTSAMDDPISNFGPRNIPRCLKAVEIMGMTQARKWEVGTLNDFRDFFGLFRHKSFDTMTKNADIQNALRDLYEHPDKVELYPGIFCESDEYMGLDPGPSESNSALWTAIFCDAITLVRSDRFYTVDWNTNSLTSWGMNEVTADNETLKSSVYHRLIQRAFPGWFPYDSVRFFHPFYTSQQNAIYANAQGYAPQFKMSKIPDIKVKDTDQKAYDVSKSEPQKPRKPIYLTDISRIRSVLDDHKDDFMHPALLHRENLPKAMQDVLDPAYAKPECVGLDEYMRQSEPDLVKYLTDLMQIIVKSRSIAMTTSTFQIDVTRDFAIPVATRYVVDFLGFGHLMRTETDPSGTYTENEIYQHITNCQTFLSYNADETKLLKRRGAFRASMAKLTELTLHGNVAQAGILGMFHSWYEGCAVNPMTRLGSFFARKILEYTGDSQKAAAILLLVCLDFAYESVNTFTAVTYKLMHELYAAADRPAADAQHQPCWLEVQDLALDGTNEAQQTMDHIIQETARAAVRLPILRTATQDGALTAGDGSTIMIRQGQMLILDTHKAIEQAGDEDRADAVTFLAYRSSFVDKFDAFQPRRFAVLALTSMIAFVANMRNVRRGHDAQGKLKRINLDWTAEGYSNFMAPGRMDWIAKQVEMLPADDKNKNVYTENVLKPETDTYLTPSWDEMVPFPITWKIRFDGFGPSDYSTKEHPYGWLTSPFVPDDAPPWYQSQGLSHLGGTFAEVAYICATPGTNCPCLSTTSGASKTNGASLRVPAAAALEPTLSTGCGLSSEYARGTGQVVAR
ncbi:hypothetical protein LTR78_001115 [Recurvomyces mirabilis]|uniref:Linoleate diol synthase n=1 Tax=Recurvomyces mirabilis TaxID=574656 RepID=A0AAE1C662_9PEZI|nr:hypothetical protein LTR78_001115 [Recurvomyces mirabilis]KAK5159087.1 hypothetical protein LTS14_003195 [Recurvomyces mirabilis]